MRTLIWITNTFRLDSRLTASLLDEVTFVYYSPYYFAGERERKIYQTCSKANLNIFYETLNTFKEDLLQEQGIELQIHKESDPIKHINDLIDVHQFDEVLIDQPLFGLWKDLKFSNIKCPVFFVDSALIDDECLKMTAKSRWMTHVKSIDSFKPYKFSKTVTPYNLEKTDSFYPNVPKTLDPEKSFKNARKVSLTYYNTRDRHDGQTNLSVLLHNGVLDPRTVFFSIASDLRKSGATLDLNEGPAASMLRQFAFREIAIIRARTAGLCLEDDALEWAKELMPSASYENLIQQKPGGSVTFEMIKLGSTGVRELDILLKPFLKSGTMPNRARMLFASLVFYNSKTGIDALRTLVDTFDLLGTDGQSPNNMISVLGALELNYGKVLKMNIDTAFKKLYG